MEAEKAGVAGHPIIYYVNAEPQETTEHQLTGGRILELAGFSPASDYELVRNAGNKKIGADELVTLHPKEAFTATFNGPTPTS
jgi:hypothetical protein